MSKQLLVQVCQNYMRANVLDSAHKIDVKHPHFQLPLEKMYMGPGVTEALAQVPVPSDPQMNPEQRMAKREQNIKAFRLQCLDFYLTAAEQPKLYLPLTSDVMREAAFIDPAVALPSNARVDQLPEVSHLYRQFKDVAAIQEDQLAQKWRNMPHEIPKEMVPKLLQMEPEDFWQEAGMMKDYRDKPKFPNLVQVARLVMALPHSNAEAEGVFAVVTDTKDKKRNRMGCDTLDSICVVRTAMRQKRISCDLYQVTEKHIEKHNNEMYKT